MRLGMLLIRLMVGIIFTAHGAQKVLSGFKMPIDMVTDIGFPAFLGIILALGELLGGIALIIGFLSNYAALGLVLIMLGALIFVHFPQGYFESEFPLILLVANIAIMISYNWKKIFEPY
ncbi:MULTISPECIES: DoxX family protein [Staphylococcus]|uniref:DoxX family protein n=1 Tax=Staphylococcus devriesei TaxID=586733 RepID=A0ABX5HYY2_9STAP|nr:MULTISPECIES: DoxX family protein [Staphylococcus]MCE5039446.1 DoxX family protein [Staphylococcus auricularis]PNZ87135.1 DoxX family protein [Staphylococcus devriesei]PTF12618.1 DoxX family protein [Staphylococcus devriesei]PTF19487.1 DoxX family protein [Staphylococcus devriesei]SUM04176.1 DoxX family protein [Staphylococcus devriesei]